MYKKFKLKSSVLNIFNHVISADIPDSHLVYANKPSDKIKQAIYETANGDISSEALIDFLFPEEKTPHIFISHSSKDMKLAIRLANKIYNESGIISFIDSQVWNHIDLAIDTMHKDYCRIPDTKSYYYTKSNSLLSNLYSLLSMSLMDVMDRSDSVIFIESQNSTIDKIMDSDKWNTGEDLSSSEATYSPWIYSEINYANKLRINYHKDRTSMMLESVEKRAGLELHANDAMPKFRHPIDISEFDEITLSSLCNAMEQFKNRHNPIKNLDLLYKLISDDNK